MLKSSAVPSIKSSPSTLVVVVVQVALQPMLLLLLLACRNIPVANPLKAEWISIPTSQKISPRRSGHTAFSSGASGATGAYVFGGYIEEDPANEGQPMVREVRNDLWKFGSAVQGWTKCEPKGAGSNMPGPRLATASAVDGDGKFAYLFGGWDPQTPGTGGIILDTVHKLNLETLEWSLVEESLPDGPTSRHVALTLPSGNEILIHNHRCIDHVMIFDTTTERFRKQPTTGSNPGSLGLHTATLVLGSTKLLVFGGAAKDGQMSNRCHVLDLKTWEWNSIELTDGESCPSPRAGACLCTYNDKIACLFGGAETTDSGLNPKGDVWALHLGDGDNSNSGRWEMLLDDKAEDDTTQPEPRNAATLTKIGDSNQFLLTGGWAPFRRTWDDVFMLSLEEDED